jgi:hypothetical protein
MSLYDNIYANHCSDCQAPTNPSAWPYLKSLCISCFKRYLTRIAHFKETNN